MLELYLAAVGGLALALGLGSRPLRQLPMTEPLAALLLGVALGPSGFDAVSVEAADEALPAVAQVSLALSVMAVALRHTWHEVRGHLTALLFLLTVVLGAMALVGAGLAVGLLGLSLPVAALLGASLAPTDPVLAASVVAGEPAERDLPLRLRLLISVESGANDGLAFVLVGLATAAVVGASLSSQAARAALQIGISVGMGAAIGWVVGRMVVWSDEHRDLEHEAFLALTVVLTLFTLGIVQLAGGSGVLAVLVAGLLYDEEISESERSEEWEVQEAINRYLIIPVFVFLGVALPWGEWAALGWAGVAFTLSVVVLRRLPLILVFRRLLGLDMRQAVFAGWFGPIGVAALYYLTELREVLDPGLWVVGSLVIATSTLLHGVSAAPGRWWYARSATDV